MNLKNKKMFGRILILVKLGQTIMYRCIARAHYSELIGYHIALTVTVTSTDITTPRIQRLYLCRKGQRENGRNRQSKIFVKLSFHEFRIISDRFKFFVKSELLPMELGSGFWICFPAAV